MVLRRNVILARCRHNSYASSSYSRLYVHEFILCKTKRCLYQFQSQKWCGRILEVNIHWTKHTRQTDSHNHHNQSATGNQTDRNSKQWRHCRQDNRKRLQNYSNFRHFIHSFKSRKLVKLQIQLRSSGWVAENVLSWQKCSDICLSLTELKTKEFHFADLRCQKKGIKRVSHINRQIEVIFIQIFFSTL